MRACVCVHAYVRTYVRVCVCVCVHTCVRASMCTCVHAYMCASLHVCSNSMYINIVSSMTSVRCNTLNMVMATHRNTININRRQMKNKHVTMTSPTSYIIPASSLSPCIEKCHDHIATARHLSFMELYQLIHSNTCKMMCRVQNNVQT